jgi:hypothetical protein
MFDSDDEWNAAFEELAVHRLEAEKATAVMMQRKNTIEREHRERGRKIGEHERLRQAAIRLCRDAGVNGVNQASFSDRTKNQLLMVIHEAQAVISGSEKRG